MTLPSFRKSLADKVPGFAVMLKDGTYTEYRDAQNMGNDTERELLWIKDKHGQTHDFPYGTVDGIGRIDFLRSCLKSQGRKKK